MSLPLELPEIETIRRDLDREIGGKKIKAVDVSSLTVIEGFKNKKVFCPTEFVNLHGKGSLPSDWELY